VNRKRVEEVCRELIYHGRHWRFNKYKDELVIRKCADYLEKLAGEEECEKKSE
jgi:hypothetical protein